MGRDGTDQSHESTELAFFQRPGFSKPFYRFFFERVFWRVPTWVLAGALLLAFSYPFSWLLSVLTYLPDSDIYALLGAFAVIFGLWALNRMYVRTLDVVGKIEHVLSNHNMTRLRNTFCLVYSNRFLIPAGVLFAVFIAVQWAYFGLRLPPVPSFYIQVWVLLAGFVAGLGLRIHFTI